MASTVKVAPIKRVYPTRCCGCGALGKFLCWHCKELQDAMLERIAKLVGTVEAVFAERAG